MENKVYTGYAIRTLGALGSAGGTQLIQAPGRKIKIRSVSIDWVRYNLTTSQMIPEAQNIQIAHDVIFGWVAGMSTQISGAFTYSSGSQLTSTGGGFRISKNCNYQFNGFYVTNSLPVVWSMYNNSADQITVSVTIIVECEISVLF
jgi:hypothetical protein